MEVSKLCFLTSKLWQIYLLNSHSLWSFKNIFPCRFNFDKRLPTLYILFCSDCPFGRYSKTNSLTLWRGSDRCSQALASGYAKVQPPSGVAWRSIYTKKTQRFAVLSCSGTQDVSVARWAPSNPLCPVALYPRKPGGEILCGFVSRSRQAMVASRPACPLPFPSYESKLSRPATPRYSPPPSGWPDGIYTKKAQRFCCAFL